MTVHQARTLAQQMKSRREMLEPEKLGDVLLALVRAIEELESKIDELESNLPEQ